MRWYRLRRCAPFAAIVVAAGLTAAPAQAAKEMRLSVDGSSSAAFDMVCDIAAAGMENHMISISETVPAERVFVADGLSCTVTLTSAGMLTIEVVSGSSVTRSRLNGAGATSRFAIR